MTLCLCGQMQVNAETMDDGTDDLVPSGINEDMLRHIEPTYLKEVTVPPHGLPTGSLVYRVALPLLLGSRMVQETCLAE